MPRKPAQDQADTLQNIRDGAFALFGRYGYDGVSIEDIARAAGLSKGALYWHFKCKNELFLDCLKRLHDIFEKHVFGRMQHEPDAILRILAFFQGMEQLLRDPHIQAGVAGYWLGIGNASLPAINQTQQAFEQRTGLIVREALQLAMDQGSLDLRGDLDDMSRAIVAIMEAIILPLRQQAPDEVHRLVGVLARALLRAYARDERLVSIADKVLIKR
jgi:TetR/AcrR family transcriptional regulator, acrAB operon repressor